MVIRELLDRLRREKEVHKAAAARIEAIEEDVLACCRRETNKTLGGRKGAKWDGQEELKAAA
jgi:hypothetical protein